MANVYVEPRPKGRPEREKSEYERSNARILRELRELERQRNMFYCTGGLTPRKLKPGWTLAHNHIRHTIDMRLGVNGFRAWWFKVVPKNFKSCSCGWSGLPHVSARPNYKCEPEKVIGAF